MRAYFIILVSQIAKLKRTQHKIEEDAKKPPEEKTSEPEPVNLGNQSMAQIIYAENRVS